MTDSALPPCSTPVRPGKVLALGRTYRAHAIELGNSPPPEPLVFNKLPDTIVPSGSRVTIPTDAAGVLDHEAELAVVIGATAWRLGPGDARAHIAGYTICNDLTMRAVQKVAKENGWPWLRAKNFPGSCPIGPTVTPVSAVPDPGDLVITCRVNGDLRQEANTRDLSWTVFELVEWLSHRWVLYPGDVISTGTPAGVGTLRAGDTCAISIRGPSVDLGTLITEFA